MRRIHKLSQERNKTNLLSLRFQYVHTPVVGADAWSGHSTGLYDRMKAARKHHRVRMGALELQHELDLANRQKKLEAIARGEDPDGNNTDRKGDEEGQTLGIDGGRKGQGGEGGGKEEEEEEEEKGGRPTTPQERRKERMEAEEEERNSRREKEVQIAAQALTSGGDMFQAMEMIAGSRPNTRDTNRSRSSTLGGSRPGTSGSARLKTPQELKRDKEAGPLTEDRIWETFRRNGEYKRRRETG